MENNLFNTKRKLRFVSVPGISGKVHWDLRLFRVCFGRRMLNWENLQTYPLHLIDSWPWEIAMGVYRLLGILITCWNCWSLPTSVLLYLRCCFYHEPAEGMPLLAYACCQTAMEEQKALMLRYSRCRVADDFSPRRSGASTLMFLTILFHVVVLAGLFSYLNSMSEKLHAHDSNPFSH